MAAIAGYRSRAAAMENQRLLLKTIRLDYFQSLPDQGVKHPLCYTIATFRARSDLVCVGDDGPVEAAGFELVHLMQTRQDSTPRGRVSNLCISEFELTETLSPGCRTRTCASRCGSWSGSAALILMQRFESSRPSQPVLSLGGHVQHAEIIMRLTAASAPGGWRGRCLFEPRRLHVLAHSASPQNPTSATTI